LFFHFIHHYEAKKPSIYSSQIPSGERVVPV
jgi:hypothetical protein